MAVNPSHRSPANRKSLRTAVSLPGPPLGCPDFDQPIFTRRPRGDKCGLARTSKAIWPGVWESIGESGEVPRLTTRPPLTAPSKTSRDQAKHLCCLVSQSAMSVPHCLANLGLSDRMSPPLHQLRRLPRLPNNGRRSGDKGIWLSIATKAGRMDPGAPADPWNRFRRVLRNSLSATLQGQRGPY